MMRMLDGIYHGIYILNTGSKAPENMVEVMVRMMNGNSRTAAWIGESPFVNWKNKGM